MKISFEFSDESNPYDSLKDFQPDLHVDQRGQLPVPKQMVFLSYPDNL
jgi:hypothetical protein